MAKSQPPLGQEAEVGKCPLLPPQLRADGSVFTGEERVFEEQGEALPGQQSKSVLPREVVTL